MDKVAWQGLGRLLRWRRMWPARHADYHPSGRGAPHSFPIDRTLVWRRHRRRQLGRQRDRRPGIHIRWKWIGDWMAGVDRAPVRRCLPAWRRLCSGRTSVHVRRPWVGDWMAGVDRAPIWWQLTAGTTRHRTTTDAHVRVEHHAGNRNRNRCHVISSLWIEE